MPQKLHEVISAVLKKAGRPLKVSQIAKIIENQQLWIMPSSGKSPHQRQVSARVNNYRHLFKRENGVVELINAEADRRLLRITYNDNLWELPSGHPWSKKNQKRTDVAFENMYGFGGEEWLFNNRYNIDGYQYGYIRGLWEVLDTDHIDTAYLFCIHPESKDRLLVAILRSLELLDPQALHPKVQKVFDNYASDMIKELRDAGADYRKANVSDIYPVLRFRMEDAVIFDRPILVNELKKGRKYNRFKPYKIDDEIEGFLSALIVAKPAIFTPGKRKITQGGHTRTIEPRTQKVAGLHNEIADELEKFLAPEYTMKKKNISIEKMVFGNNIADFVLEQPDKKLVLIEIKTSSNARYNMREALGQLLDYANWDAAFDIDELIIISPSALSAELKQYFLRMKKSLRHRLSYWQYCRENDKTEKFIKY